MKRFQCQCCGNEVHFENTICVNCGRRLGYIAEEFAMAAVEPSNGAWSSAAHPNQEFKFCANWELDACNWLLPAVNTDSFCEACRHNRAVPNLGIPENIATWRKMELAKRFLFYSLIKWRLPRPTRSVEVNYGLVFDFLADNIDASGAVIPVLTGHDDGIITINIAEADDAERERRRTSMKEPYRTLLGHFRHEIGHYYWDRLVLHGGPLEEFRALFGDERADYAEALKRHYTSGPPSMWQDAYISSYATSHPWEDFAETWAHYTHMVDTLETARAYGLKLHSPAGAFSEVGVEFSPYKAPSITAISDAWPPLTVALNAVNRSMGQRDMYPFVLSGPVIEKLNFIHGLIHPEQAAAKCGERRLMDAGRVF
jgi:hypothetical protein